MEHSDIYTNVLAKAYVSCTSIEQLKTVANVIQTLDADAFHKTQHYIKLEMEAKSLESRIDQLLEFGQVPFSAFNFDGGRGFFNMMTDIKQLKQHSYQKLMVATTLEYMWRNPLCGDFMGIRLIKESKKATKIAKLAWFYSTYFQPDLCVSDVNKEIDHPNIAPYRFLVITHQDLIDAHNLPVYYGNGTIYFKPRLDSKVWKELEQNGMLARFVAKYTRMMKQTLGYVDIILESANERSILEQAQIIWWLEFDRAYGWIMYERHNYEAEEDTIDSDCEDLRQHTFYNQAIYEY